MNDHFEGVKIDANAGGYNHQQHSGVSEAAVTAHDYPLPGNQTWDGKTKDITFTAGSNLADGKGNITVYAGYRKVDAILEGQRDFSACSLNRANGGSSLTCGGSSSSATGRFIPLNGSGDFTVGPGGAFVPFTTADRYNYAPTNYFQRPDERWTGGAFFHYDLTDTQQVYSELMFMHDDSTAQIAPGALFLGTGTAVDPTTGIPNGSYNINCANPFLSASELAALCNGSTAGVAQTLIGRRDVEGGTRDSEFEHTSFRMVVGTKGDFLDGAFHYDTYAMEGETLYQSFLTGNLSVSHAANALEAVAGPNNTPVCLSGAQGCVPYNIFTPGGVTPAQLAYLAVPALLTGQTEERVWDGNITGDLGKYGLQLPGTKDGLSVNLGSQWRSESVTLHPDYEQISNDLGNNPLFPLEAGFNVWEVYGEAGLPLVQDQPFVKDLAIDAGYRFSKYNLGFHTNTYKFGVEYAPTADFRIRGSYQHAVRAPNLQELFQQKFVGIDGSADPCATSSGSPPTASKAQCARSGLSAAQYPQIGNPAGQYNGQLGGNPQLKPESSDTTSFGLIVTPTEIPGLQVSFDYFNIVINGVISTYGANFSLNACIFNDNPQFCSLIHRDASGSLWLSQSGYVTDGYLNLGSLHTRGADVTAAYPMDLGPGGKINLNFLGTYTAQLFTEPAPGYSLDGISSYNCAGYFGNTCGIPTPKFKSKFRASWLTPLAGLDFSAQWRHVNAVIEDTRSPNPLLAGTTPAVDRRLAEEDYLDLTLSYQVTKQVSARVGVNNVFDKDPPIVAGGDFSSAFANGNTYAQVYDTLGRYVFANVTLQF